MVGVNHHFDSCVFAFVLLLDETIDILYWLLKTFFNCMSGKKLSVILTDGDLAMKAAVSQYMPHPTH